MLLLMGAGTVAGIVLINVSLNVTWVANEDPVKSLHPE
jgi:hypothetical protein